MTTLQENIPGSTRKKKLRNVFRLIQIVDKATDNFTTAAENIATDNPEFQVSWSVVQYLAQLRQAPSALWNSGVINNYNNNNACSHAMILPYFDITACKGIISMVCIVYMYQLHAFYRYIYIPTPMWFVCV